MLWRHLHVCTGGLCRAAPGGCARVCYGPARTTLAELVQVAGTRWMVESGFQAGKGQTGLDHYQVRRYQAWYRHVTLAMAALAFVAVMRARAAPVGAGAAECAEVAELVPPSVPEIRRLLVALVWRLTPDPNRVLRWSLWRRRHQARARRCHWPATIAPSMAWPRPTCGSSTCGPGAGRTMWCSATGWAGRRVSRVGSKKWSKVGTTHLLKGTEVAGYSSPA
jgi:hypothetical protein